MKDRCKLCNGTGENPCGIDPGDDLSPATASPCIACQGSGEAPKKKR